MYEIHGTCWLIAMHYAHVHTHDLYSAWIFQVSSHAIISYNNTVLSLTHSCSMNHLAMDSGVVGSGVVGSGVVAIFSSLGRGQTHSTAS